MTKKQLKSASVACRNVLKSATIHQPARTGLHKGWIDKSGHKLVCDGFHILKFNSDIPIEMEYNPASDVCKNVEEYVDEVDSKSCRFEELELPDIDEIKFAAKTFKVRTPIYYDFGEGRPSVNPKYLWDCIRALPKCRAFFNPNYLHGPMFFKSDDGVAVLLPVRKY